MIDERLIPVRFEGKFFVKKYKTSDGRFSKEERWSYSYIKKVVKIFYSDGTFTEGKHEQYFSFIGIDFQCQNGAIHFQSDEETNNDLILNLDADYYVLEEIPSYLFYNKFKECVSRLLNLVKSDTDCDLILAEKKVVPFIAEKTERNEFFSKSLY